MSEFRRRLMTSVEADKTPNYAKLDLYGVAIMDVRNKFYRDAESWISAGSPIVNGIAVSDGTHRLCIAKDLVENTFSNDRYGEDADYFGGYKQGISNYGGTIAESVDVALNDFNGLDNTDKLMTYINRSDGYFTVEPWSAAALCNKFVFPNGKAGYIGAAGEWSMVGNKKTEINALLSAIGGELLVVKDSGDIVATYWTSTINSATDVYVWDLMYDECVKGARNTSRRHIRAFCAI